MTANPLSILIDAFGSENAAKLAVEALERAGWVLVPREPTAEMLDAAWAYALDEDAVGVWKSMLQSVPQ